jgi:hypothetical protein
MLKMKIAICILFTLFVTKNVLAQDSTQRKTNTDSVFSKVDKEAEFPSGDAGWRNYIERNLDPNIPINNKAPEGSYQVMVNFIVNKDGSINYVNAETHFGYGMEDEAVRIIKNSPKWIAGSQNGRLVNSYRRQPITFLVLQDTTETKATSDNLVYTKVDKEAEFPGGFIAWRDYLINNLHAFVPVDNLAPVGSYQVIVRFIVDKDGSLSNVSAETHFGYGMEAEAVRVIKNGPKWKPGSQNGRLVNSYRRQPITFEVQGFH